MDDGGADLDEEYYIVSVEAGMSTGVTEVVSKELEEVHRDMDTLLFLSYILKPPSLLTHGFK